MKLYDYFRSSAAYRVRIALNIKGLAYQQTPINLRKGDQNSEDYQRVNPQQLVPSLVLDDGVLLTQSLAICEYLDEIYPEPPLLPANPLERARVRALAQIVACEMHPLNNLRVLKYLVGPLGVSDEAKVTWYQHWIAGGFSGLEGMLAKSPDTGRFCHGDTPTLADVCLVPQVANARRFDCDLSPYPTVVRIDETCHTLPAFEKAHPSRQPDAV